MKLDYKINQPKLSCKVLHRVHFSSFIHWIRGRPTVTVEENRFFKDNSKKLFIFISKLTSKAHLFLGKNCKFLIINQLVCIYEKSCVLLLRCFNKYFPEKCQEKLWKELFSIEREERKTNIGGSCILICCTTVVLLILDNSSGKCCRLY